MELRYLRDVDSKEVDFVVIKIKNRFAVECRRRAASFKNQVL